METFCQIVKELLFGERLLENLNDIDWPESTKEIQRNWIGKSIGAHVTFKVDGFDKEFTVFTTRCDTLFGATYCVLAPEHEFVDEIMYFSTFRRIRIIECKSIKDLKK